jgi:geranylgeranyl reductase family protein
MTTFDVAIVGAGPAGSSLAVQLAGSGLDVALLDRHAFPRDKTCGDLVSAKALRLLDGLGCLPAIESHNFLPLRETHTALNGEWLNTGWVPYEPGTVEHAHTVPREILDEIIFRKAQEAGATSFEGCRVQDVTIEKDLVTLGAQQQGESRTYTARMVVGADGAQSVVARKVGQAMTDRRYMEYAMRAYCHGLQIEETVVVFEEDFFPGFGWVFPISKEFANIGVGLVADSAKKFGLDLNEFYRRLVKRLEDWAADEGWKIEIEKPIGWPIKTYGGASNNFFDRGLLVGEAGCFVDPINGEGIPLALESASVAAATITEAFDKGRFERNSLSSYETNWRTKFDADLGLSDLIVSMIRNRHLLRTWIDVLRLICATAESDPDYAWKTGGVLAGTVPIRKLLRPDVLWKSVAHGPRFWMDFFGISRNHLLKDLFRRGIELGRWELSTLVDLARDSEWQVQWGREVARKQSQVMASNLPIRQRDRAL